MLDSARGDLSLDFLPSCHEQPRAEMRCWLLVVGCWLGSTWRPFSFLSFLSFFLYSST